MSRIKKYAIVHSEKSFSKLLLYRLPTAYILLGSLEETR